MPPALPLLTAKTIATTVTAATNHCPLLLPPQPLPLFLLLFSLVMFNILLGPSNILNIFAAALWLIDVCPHAASAFATVACPRHCAFANLLVIVATCAASTASCMSLITMGGGADTSAQPRTTTTMKTTISTWPRRKWGILAALYQSTSPCHFATLPLLVKFDVQNITFTKEYFEHHPGERLHAPPCHCHRFCHNRCHNCRHRQ